MKTYKLEKCVVQFCKESCYWSAHVGDEMIYICDTLRKMKEYLVKENLINCHYRSTIKINNSTITRIGNVKNDVMRSIFKEVRLIAKKDDIINYMMADSITGQIILSGSAKVVNEKIKFFRR